MTSDRNIQQEPLRIEARRPAPFAKRLILPLTILSGCLLGIAMPNLISGSALEVACKSLFLAGAATTVAYGVNRLAIEKGAPLTSIGYLPAGIASVLSISVVGGGLYAATYAGLTMDDVAELRLQEHGTALSQYVAGQNERALQAQRLGPVANVVVADLSAKLDCEVRESCVSGRNSGGRGPVAREIDEKLGRARAILVEVEAGKAARIAAQDELNQLIGRYQAVLSETGKPVETRRARLQAIDAQIRQQAGELAEALPVLLLAAYASELKEGAVIAERPEATRRLSAILRGHGRMIDEVLGKSVAATSALPAFPGRPGVADTFSYLGKFLPIAAIVTVVELVFPLTLWLYTLLALKWRAYRISPPERPRVNADDDVFGGALLRSDRPALPAPRRQGARSRRGANGRYRPSEN